MMDQEKQKASHLMILLCYTLLTMALTAESILLGWEMSAVVLVLLGLVASWVLHITGKVQESARIWIYFVITMLTFFFYGIHETSMYDMALLMVVIILMYSVTEMYRLVWLCVLVYYLTMAYDLLFVVGERMEVTPLSVSRTLLHFALVYMAAYLINFVAKKRRRETEEAESRIATLEETNRRTEDFLTNVSHELRTPINAVTGITGVMLKSEEKEERRKNILSIQRAGYRLFEQIEEILDYTEIDTGRLKVSEDSYMVSSLVNDVISGIRMMEKENLPELIFDIDPQIPLLLLGDVKKLKKILKHLINNSIKFTKNGAVYIRIYARKKPYGVNLCLEISDTGIGIEEENLKRITEKFYQSSQGRDRRAGGLGLGLSIVHGLVSVMEGFMRIESTVESGTKVSVCIPQKVADDSPGMIVQDRSELCLAVFLVPERYEALQTGTYYNRMIAHLVKGLDIPVHRISSMEELRQLNEIYALTHLFVGQQEYEENKAYFEDMAQKMEVIVIAEEDYAPSAGSRSRILRKPFYCFPVASILNGRKAESEDMFEGKRMICPEVKVLVVDDEPMNLMVAEGIFKEYQMQVKTVSSGLEALMICEKEEFDLIFLDHMMPEMDGVETLKRLRKINTPSEKELTVIAFTANAVSGAREMFFQEGFDEFVAKPVETMEIERVLRKVLPKNLIQYTDAEPEKKEKAQEGNDKVGALEVSGINTRAGIGYCAGDADFYLNLLMRFSADKNRKEQEMTRYYQEQDLKNYQILVHSLKSSSKMIGADALSEMARQAEEAAKNQNLDFISAHHGELLEKWQETVESIDRIIGAGEEKQTQPEAEEGEEITKEELLAALTELKESLDTFEADKAEEVLSAIGTKRYQGTSIQTLTGEIRRDVEDFDLGAAQEKAAALLHSIEGGKA